MGRERERERVADIKYKINSPSVGHKTIYIFHVYLYLVAGWIGLQFTLRLSIVDIKATVVKGA